MAKGKKRRNNKSSKRKSARQSKSRYEPILYERLPSPFEGMTEDQVFEQFKSIGKTFDSKFNESFQQLQDQIRTVDPLLLLSFFTFYGRVHFNGQDPELTQENPVLQYQVELLQAIALRYSLGQYELNSVSGAAYKNFHDFIRQTAEAFNLKRFAALGRSMPEQERERLMALDRIRSETQAVRNWGYPQHVTSVVAGLFERLEDTIEQKYGIRIAHSIEMWLKLKAIAEERTKFHINQVHSITQTKNIYAAVRKYYECFPEPESTPEETLRLVEKYNLKLPRVREMLICYSELHIPAIFTFSLADFLDAYPKAIEPDLLKSVLREWSFSFGDLADANAEFFFLANPIWSKPLIRLEEDIYFWPVIELFLSFCLELMESIIKDDAELKERYERRRGKYLESETERLFKAAFPSAKLYRGSLWHDPTTGKDFENDLLVLVDSYLIIIEAKGGKISDRARRGDPARLKREIEDLLINPSQQAKRFADYLQANPRKQQFPTLQGKLNEIETSSVYEIIRLNITMESFGSLGARWPLLHKAGFIQSKADMAPTMSLVDLQIIFEILEGTCEKLHYLVRRAEFENNADYIGDEMDLLAFYMDTGFNVGEMEFDQTNRLYLTGEGCDSKWDLLRIKGEVR